MSPNAILVAVTLLTAPPGTPEQPISPEEWPAIQQALHSVAVQMEILDPRETKYVLTRLEDFEADLNLLRRRNQELADAPQLADSLRLPDRSTANELLAFNVAYRRNLAARQCIDTDRCSMLRQVLSETDWLYQVWDSVRDARCEFYYVTVRRQALKRLFNLLGEESYLSGELPPAVPVWRFTAVN